ncbi:MAG: response regulator [Anaerolineales bacterium]|nr:response regulator [Anaerolineales bacterium]
MAKPPIRLLLVEDNPTDVLLLRQALARDAWAWFEVTAADRLSQGLAFWHAQPFVGVLLDLGLPDSQGLATFEAFQRGAPGAPVVVLSGLLDEHLAVSAVQAGAQDYLVKGQAGWDSIPRALRYAIERQQTRLALQASERRFRALIEQSGDAVALLASDGTILYESPAATRVLGWLPEEMLGRNAFEFIHPEGQPAGMALFGQLLEQPRTPIIGEIQYRHKDGGWRWVEATGTNLLDDPSVGAIVVNYRAVDERRQAAAALQTSQARLAEALRIARLAYWEYDVAADLFTFNDQFYALLRTTAEREGGYRMSSRYYAERFVHPGDLDVVSLEIAKAIEATDPQYQAQLDHRILYADGEVGYFGVHLWIEKDAQGRTAHARGANQDITERKRAEAALRASQDRYRALFDDSPAAVWEEDFSAVQARFAELRQAGVTDFDAYFAAHPEVVAELAAAVRVTAINQASVPLLGGRDKADILHNLSLYFTAESSEVFRRELATLAHGGTSFRADIPVLNLAGEPRLLEISLRVMPGAEADLDQVLVSFIDITERQRAEAALRASTEQMQALVTSLDDLVFEFDAQGTYLNVWSGNDSLLAQPKADLLGRRIVDVLGEGPGRQYHDLIQRVLATGQPDSLEYELEVGAGPRWFLARVSPIPAAAGPTQAVSMLVRDITERKQAEQAIHQLNAELEQRVAQRTRDLSRANAELQRAARAKDEFLASMSHELRTPLNAILTLTEALEEGVYGPLGERQNKPLRLVAESGQHLLSLINDILDLAKIEAGKLEIQIAPVEAEALCQASLRLVRQQAHKKHLAVELNLDPGVRFLYADGRRLKQMLVNLLSNAVKFTPENGQIGLDVRADAAAGAVHFTVWDTGIGIAPEEAGRLFQPFVQVDSGLDRQYGGSGLGLSLVYRMAELQGGSVALTSTLGQGSRFTISLPWDEANPPPPPEVPRAFPALAGRRVLVVEDSSAVSEQLTRYLTEWGAQAAVDLTGATAVDQARAAPPDVVLLDLQLPARSGWEVLEQLRADPQTRALPVVVVAVSDEQERARALGAADYIVKPVTRARLREALGKALGPAPDARTPRPVLLLAEDNLAVQSAFFDYLTAKGYDVQLAGTGAEALRRVYAARPDLILMDVQMPELDGLEAIRRLRADPAFRTLPIVALTALAMPGDQERCLAAGADSYLTKPVRLDLLAQTVAARLQNGAGRAV